MDDLTGSTEVRFGPFLAMTGASQIEDTDTKAVWKVWVDQDGKNPRKIIDSLTRSQAVALASSCAQEWRRIGRPLIYEVEVMEEPHRFVINSTWTKLLVIEGGDDGRPAPTRFERILKD